MNIFNIIGNTPLVEICHLNKNKNVKLLAKLEGQNPGGSVKDRAAYSMISGALERKEIKPNQKIIEPTSGNTGIALSMIASMYGLEIELVMPENSTKERVLAMQAFGAKVTLTPAEASMEGAIDYVKKVVEKGEGVMLNQFGNPDNPLAHYKTTGPEIWRDTEGSITHFVSAMGTTGTIMGTSRFLKEKNPNIQIVGVRPGEGARIPGIRRWKKEYLPTIFDEKEIDCSFDVTQEQAEQTTQDLARKEGIFAGTSSGGAVNVALRLCEQLEKGIIVVIICDRGDRYLSTDVFKNVLNKNEQ